MDPSTTELENAKLFGRTNTKAFTEAKVTPVILVCIYNKNSTLITHDLLYNVFSAYGKILRILIFEKVKVWKAFIEYSTVEEAVEAKRNLNDFLLFNDGTRINIYPSNLDCVKFQNNNSGGVDYTQTEQPDLSQFKCEFPLPVPEAAGNIQTEATPTYQNQFNNENNAFDQFAERSTSTNSQSQPNSGKLKWPGHESEEHEDRFTGQHYDQNRDVFRYDQGPIPETEEQEQEQDEEGHFVHQFLNDAFPASWNDRQDLGLPKRKAQALQLNSPAFTIGQPKQPPPMHQNPMQQSPGNPNQYWQGGQSNNMNNPNMTQNNIHDDNAPPGLMNFYSGQNRPEPMQNQREPPKMIRMTNSFTDIPLRQNLQGPSTLSRHATFTDLPPSQNPSTLSRHATFTDLPSKPMNNPGPMNPGMLPRYATFTDLPKSSSMLKPGLPHFGSVTNFGGLGQSGMNQGLHQGPPQLNKPMLNSRFGSTPELPLMSEISKYKLDSMSSQSIRDLIERDILLRLMMNQIQSGETNDLIQQNVNPINDLNDIKKFSPALQGIGNVDYNNLAQMNKGTLDNIYQELSSLLGKSVENNKECAVLYVKGLEHKDIKVRMLYNIFSNFGNIKKIIFIRRQAAALIEYETVEYAVKAKEDLSNIVFMGKPLRIYYSFHPIINLKNKKNGKDASEEIFIGTPKTFRFGKTKNISMNPPSSTLHVSNLTKEVCNEMTMRDFFSPCGRIEAIQIKCMENNRNMCLIRMASMEESLNAMAYLHDVELGGRPVQISFTKSKI